jgi:hypothetical protein
MRSAARARRRSRQVLRRTVVLAIPAAAAARAADWPGRARRHARRAGGQLRHHDISITNPQYLVVAVGW